MSPLAPPVKRSAFHMVLLSLSVIMLVGCSLCPMKQDIHTSQTASDELRKAAIQTYVSYNKAIQAGEEEQGSEIPAAYWKEGIKQLKPIRVYLHGFNLVVVQNFEDGVEQGKYISLPISSYIPKSGDDSFIFTSYPRSIVEDAEVEAAFDFIRPVGEEVSLKGTLKVHPKFLYRYYIDGVGYGQKCGLFGKDEVLKSIEPGSMIRVEGRLGARLHEGGTKENPSPFPQTSYIYMEVDSVDLIEPVVSNP